MVTLASDDLGVWPQRRARHPTRYRDDQERFNVWVAYLNLEASFGSKVRGSFAV